MVKCVLELLCLFMKEILGMDGNWSMLWHEYNVYTLLFGLFFVFVIFNCVDIRDL